MKIETKCDHVRSIGSGTETTYQTVGRARVLFLHGPVAAVIGGLRSQTVMFGSVPRPVHCCLQGLKTTDILLK